MSESAIIAVKKKSTILEFVRDAFVVPETGSRVAVKEAAALLVGANPQLAEQKQVAAGTEVFVPAEFPLRLKAAVSRRKPAARIDVVPRLKRAIEEIDKPDEQEAEAAKLEHDTTMQLIDIAMSSDVGREFADRLERIRAVADEKLQRSEVDHSDRSRRVERLNAALQELSDALASLGR